MAKFITETIILTLTGILMSITLLMRKKIAGALMIFAERFFHWKVYENHGHIGKPEMEKNEKVIRLLTELRLQTKSDRAQVFQFKNGEIFTSKNQIWRVMCTHEVVDAVQSTLDRLQNILSSSVTDLIYPFWDNGDLSNYPGIVRISPRACKCVNIETCSCPRGIYFYRVNGIKPGYSKSLLQSHNVCFMLQTPIFDPQDNIVGFVGLDWCYDDANVNDIESYATILCKTASIISYELTPKKYT